MARQRDSEERDATDHVTKRYFSQGVQISSANYYYTRDHLGSVREVTSSAGAIVSRYDYDPYGRTTLVQGTNLADFQYAGYYAHTSSGLFLTKYRAYDPDKGRWLSRDPIGMQGGINLYGYTQNSPTSFIDQSGLCSQGLSAYDLLTIAVALIAALIILFVVFAPFFLFAVPFAVAEASVLTEAAGELYTILDGLEITDATVGIRGSAVTGYSYTTGLAFNAESDLDFFIESNQLLRGLVTNSKGMVYSSILEGDAFPEIAAWSARWSAILQRDVNVAGWLLGRVPSGLFF